MIKTLVAYTSEIDNTEAAVSEISAQLDLGGSLCANSVGIIACHYEFVFSGAVKAICDSLPFPVAGTITSAQAVNGRADTLLLTLTVLTSDDVSFRTVLTPSLLGSPGSTIESAYAQAAADIADRPKLVLTFAPFLVQNSGDEYVSVITKASGGAPCFGTLAVDDTQEFTHCYMLYNGEHYRDRMAMVLVYGELDPRFYIATISENKIIGRSALITASEGHILKEVNGRPVVDYFKDLGLTKQSETSYAMTSLPFMLDYGDGTPPVSKVFIGMNEQGYAICAGAMPEGSAMYIGVFDKDDVLLTTREALRKAVAGNSGASGMMIYSCISRNMSMGGDQLAELELVMDGAGRLPFMMAYSGGEMCPTQIGGGGAINRFHNNAFILCIF